MKMTKPTPSDIDAAGELLGLLEVIGGRFGGPYGSQDGGENLFELLEQNEESFDYDDPTHLKTLANHLAKLMRVAPGFALRVIGGMCYVVLYEKNKMVDPAADTLEVHPDVAQALEDARRYRWAISSEDNAELLYAAVLNNAPHAKAISDEINQYLAASEESSL